MMKRILKEKKDWREWRIVGLWKTQLRGIRSMMEKDRLERELFHSCILLKNLAAVHINLPMSADFVLEHLMDSAGPLKPIYADVLTAYRRGNGENAFSLLYRQVPTKTARDFGRILSKWESVDPGELVLQMTAFEETFTAERKTKAMERAERKSMVTTVAATASVFTVLLNFTVVVIFLDTMEILGNLF